MTDSFTQAYAFLRNGGPMMLLLLLISIVCITLIFERFSVLKRKRVFPPNFLSQLNALLSQNQLQDLLSLCRVSALPIGRVLEAGLSRTHQSASEIQEAMEVAGKKEASRLEKNLDYLSIIASVAPLIGLLGTVTGMISTFGVIQLAGVGDPTKLSGGISEALLTTAGGLAVGIPALIFQRLFQHRVDGYLLEMEEISRKVLDSIKASK